MRFIVGIGVLIVIGVFGSIAHAVSPPSFQPAVAGTAAPNEATASDGTLLDFRDATYSIGWSSVEVDGYIVNTGSADAQNPWVICHATDTGGGDHLGQVQSTGYIGAGERYPFHLTIDMGTATPADTSPACTVLWKQ
jgi:hypothetical protein